ncbi:hypothetical protein KSS87_009525 [Heliosperma pusillum]|nr:hypothetical protein KSS87_009525 [Heliosperma pusillum]
MKIDAYKKDVKSVTEYIYIKRKFYYLILYFTPNIFFLSIISLKSVIIILIKLS